MADHTGLAVAGCPSALGLHPQPIEKADSAALSWLAMENGLIATD